MKPKISVIVLTYNQEKYIGKTLDGIFMQDYEGPVELIISNDASTDSTHAVIQKYIARKPENIEIVYTPHPQNIGATPNMYDALTKVTGKYLAFCEGDDYWTDPKKLTKQHSFMEQNPEYAICFHSVSQVDEEDNIIPDKQFSSIMDRDYTAREIYRHWQVHTTSVFMKSKVLQNEAVKETLKNPDLLYFDTPLYMAAEKTGKMRGNPAIMSSYRRHNAGISFGKNLSRDLKHNIYDQTIGNYWGGKIKDISSWLIFNRSRTHFLKSIEKGDFHLAWQYLKWMASDYKKAGIFILEKIKNGRK